MDNPCYWIPDARTCCTGQLLHADTDSPKDDRAYRGVDRFQGNSLRLLFHWDVTQLLRTLFRVLLRKKAVGIESIKHLMVNRLGLLAKISLAFRRPTASICCLSSMALVRNRFRHFPTYGSLLRGHDRTSRNMFLLLYDSMRN